MNQDLTPQERVERARRAKALLEDPIFTEAVDASVRAHMDRFLASDRPDARLADLAWAAKRIADGFRDDLRRILNDGLMAAESQRRR